MSRSPAGRTLYSLGTSHRSWEEFIEILLAYGVECLIDVRSYPRSKHEHFSRERLEPALAENGIQYLFLGRELGGYEAYAGSDDFMRGIDAVEEAAAGKPSVIVCGERFPWKCHRRWIARELQRRGWRVLHILDKDRAWEAKRPAPGPATPRRTP